MHTYKLTVYTESWQQDKDVEHIIATQVCKTWYIHAGCMVFTFDSELSSQDILKLIPCESTIANFE